MAGRDIWRAEDKITRRIRAYQRARRALEYLDAGNKVMDKYRPIRPQDLALSGDVVGEQRLWQRNDTLVWFWCIASINQEQEMSGWMSVSDEAGSPLVLLHKALQVYRVNWLRAKAQMDRWQEEVTLIQNEIRWMHLWLVYHRNIWEGRATKCEQEGLKGHACYPWKQVWMWERMANEAMDVYSRVMMSTNG